jgi:hypothetical protein
MKLTHIALMSALLACNSAWAHHSWTASYTTDIITVEGYVDRYVFRNPHVITYLNVTYEKTGKTTRWMSEGAAATGLRLAAWDENTLAKGDHIRITGKAGRNNRPMVSLAEVSKLDPETGAAIKINLNRRVLVPDDPSSPDFAFPAKNEDGLVNMTGIWTQGGEFDPEPSFLLNEKPVFTPAGQAIQDTILATNDPQYTRCIDPGLVRQAGTTPHPVRVSQYEDRVVFHYEEYAGDRVIYLDGRDYDSFDENKRYKMGRNKGYYEGDSFVIETDLLSSEWGSIFGQVTSEQASVVETYTRGFDEKWGPYLHMSMIVTDPVNFAQPWEVFWDKYYTVKNFTGTERDNVQLDYKMVPVECQIPLGLGT